MAMVSNALTKATKMAVRLSSAILAILGMEITPAWRARFFNRTGGMWEKSRLWTPNTRNSR